MGQLFRIKISGYGTKNQILDELSEIMGYFNSCEVEDGDELEFKHLFTEIHETTEEQEL